MFFRRPNVPEHMEAALVSSFDSPDGLQVVPTAVGSPGPGEVLVRMAYAPIHPADLVSLRGRYGSVAPLPFVPGLEGSGTVIKSGGGLAGRALVGRRVAVLAFSTAQGTWAPYLVVPASHCVPLSSGVSLARGATLLINPLTAIGLLEPELHAHRSVLVTVAAGALGRMILAWGQHNGLHMIGCVHREAQREALKKSGHAEIFNAAAPEFPAQLRILCRRYQIHSALDATGGPLVGQLLSHLEEPGRVVIYGLLSRESAPLPGFPIIFRDVGVTGFWLQRWWAGRSLIERMRRAVTIQMKPEIFDSPVQAKVPLAHVREAISLAIRNRSEGKVLLRLDPELDDTE
ncbi:zinc-binding dehydrogenase [Myxococcota bacterium]|nr:zinc-binding dehydrogenase [Myxococcota bacterium]MBU1410330.1 zinc-binding dehydrogenase [Myxococcota bacterium]MBU1509800.1 zinc-binding dehydrogenase [Myxococcota bacterium]